MDEWYAIEYYSSILILPLLPIIFSCWVEYITKDMLCFQIIFIGIYSPTKGKYKHETEWTSFWLVWVCEQGPHYVYYHEWPKPESKPERARTMSALLTIYTQHHTVGRTLPMD